MQRGLFSLPENNLSFDHKSQRSLTHSMECSFIVQQNDVRSIANLGDKKYKSSIYN